MVGVIRKIGVVAEFARRQNPALNASGYETSDDFGRVAPPARYRLKGVGDEADFQPFVAGPDGTTRRLTPIPLTTAMTARTVIEIPPAMPSPRATAQSGGE